MFLVVCCFGVGCVGYWWVWVVWGGLLVVWGSELIRVTVYVADIVLVRYSVIGVNY